MAQDFIYFAGTLPMLFFGEKPPMTLSQFNEDAARLIGEKVSGLLATVTFERENSDGLPPAVQKYLDWENSLRNSWLDVRKKQRPDAVEFKRNNPDFYSEIAPALAQAANMDDLLEAEKVIDRLRWNALENFSVGHYSDFEFLAFYYLKLQILSKYTVRTAENGNRALEKILSTLSEASKTN